MVIWKSGAQNQEGKKKERDPGEMQGHKEEKTDELQERKEGDKDGGWDRGDK